MQITCRFSIIKIIKYNIEYIQQINSQSKKSFSTLADKKNYRTKRMESSKYIRFNFYKEDSQHLYFIIPKDRIIMTISTQTKHSAQNLLKLVFKPFLIGSISGAIATTVIQPIGTVGVIIQSRREAAGRAQINLSPFFIVTETIKNNGIFGLYKGLDSALLRQVVYTGLRLGLFRAVQEDIKTKQNRNMTLTEKTLYSMAAGLIGSGIANPLDMALIRFQADTTLPLAERRNYQNVFDALSKMNKELKFFGMWRGSIPTIARAMAMNSCILVAYNETKQRLLKHFNQTKQTKQIRLIGSALSGISGCLGALPFDNIKTKILKMKPNAAGELPYKNMLDCLFKTIAREGIFSLWVGISTFYFRVAPHAMISILAQDYLHDMLKKE